MRTTQQLSITLPTEMAEAVKAKVASGEYASESEVIPTGCARCLPGIVRSRLGCGSRLYQQPSPWMPIPRGHSQQADVKARLAKAAAKLRG